MADISKITLPSGETYNIDAVTVDGHTVKSNVPSNAVFTDTIDLNSMTGTLSISKGGTGATNAENARTSLGLGSAAVKEVDTAISSTSTNIPTTAAVINYIETHTSGPFIVDKVLAMTDTTKVYIYVGN